MIDDILQRMNQEYVEAEEVKQLFCSALTDQEPAHCQSSFAITNNWLFPYQLTGSSSWIIPPLTNGCGTGSFVESLVTTYMDIDDEIDFSGDRNAPAEGFSFYASCNNHDACYSTSTNKNGCDSGFYSSMNDVCGSNSLCNSYAKLYSSAVEIYGEDAHKEALLTHQCRKYQEDFEKNCSSAISSNTSST
ncbi:MAG: hypothetical protein ACPGTQ_00260 [Colwellia sp.]